jgi:hypothetical protein
VVENSGASGYLHAGFRIRRSGLRAPGCAVASHSVLLQPGLRPVLAAVFVFVATAVSVCVFIYVVIINAELGYGASGHAGARPRTAFLCIFSAWCTEMLSDASYYSIVSSPNLGYAPKQHRQHHGLRIHPRMSIARPVSPSSAYCD